MKHIHEARRRFLVSAAAGAGFALGACARTPDVHAAAPGGAHAGGEAEPAVSPPEDLMREHGVLNRILLIYEEGVHRLDARQPIPIETIASAADIIRRFIEQYHEKLEEDFLFPRFERANTLVDLVATLRRQHQAGRALTEAIVRGATAAGVADDAARRKLADTLRLFVRMYRPHEAREDTVLFPALRSIVGEDELDALGEQFEDKEHELFGKEGFEGVVAQVAALEQKLGIYELSQFTPPAP